MIHQRHSNHRFNRRAFLQTTAITAIAPFLLPSGIWAAESQAKPNARITLGFIGVGEQGRGLLNGFLSRNEVQVVAVCDVDTTRREHGKRMVEDFYAKNNTTGAKGVTVYGDFRELLNREDINAVCIAAPDHCWPTGTNAHLNGTRRPNDSWGTLKQTHGSTGSVAPRGTGSSPTTGKLEALHESERITRI